MLNEIRSDFYASPIDSKDEVRIRALDSKLAESIILYLRVKI